jgi:hypothetical protein
MIVEDRSSSATRIFRDHGGEAVPAAQAAMAARSPTVTRPLDTTRA